MSPSAKPLVSVLTPVYNGEKYLAECIESVLAQTYSNLEYFVLNNASTDGTLQIAEKYARMDKRVRVHSNETLLPIIANHNKAFGLVASPSKYCKIVSADDWLFPECLTRMVDLAEAHPSVGIIGSYQLSGGGSDWRGWRVRWDELPYPSNVIPGREICRRQMLDNVYVFGTPTSILYRSDLVMETDEFYPNPTAEGDTSACYRCLQKSDFGFVHDILSYERDHNVRMTTQSLSFSAYIPSKISDLVNYGANFLSAEEFEHTLEKLMGEYYTFLGISAVNFRDGKFWAYHKDRLETIGYPLDRVRLGKAVFLKIIDLALNPKQTVEKAMRRTNPNPGVDHR
jgi:glycosyltransferase involved in cell wall biosynthesis